jgi:transposase
MHFFERLVDGRLYRVVAQSVWNPRKQQPVSRQVLLGPADPPPVADLARTRTVGTKRVGDTGALAWVGEQLDVVRLINEACGAAGPAEGPSVGELALGVALQRACAPGAKRDLAAFLDSSVARISCLPAERFTGQAFHRGAAGVTAEQLERAQLAIARAAVTRFELSADVLAFDSTNFDTHIATTTPGALARRGHAKSKRGDLRVVGLGVLVSESGHVPLLHRTYPGNSSDQAVLTSCLKGLAQLHDELDAAEGGATKVGRTVVRDGGFWSEQLELELESARYHSLISLPLSHTAAEQALIFAAQRGHMRPLRGRLEAGRAARLETRVGELERTLLVVESQELLRGQKRGIAVALRKAKRELCKLERRVKAGKLERTALEARVTKALVREHLAEFVVTTIGGTPTRPTFSWKVDAARRRDLERTRLGRRVLCTTRKLWSTERIVHAFRGQWNVEELFRRSKKGGLVPWGPSYQWADASLQLHTFATVLGLTLVALAKLAHGAKQSAPAFMQELADINATLVRTNTGETGRRPTVMLPPELSSAQQKAVRLFELDRWMPSLSSTMNRPSSTQRRTAPANGRKMRKSG